jgi:glycosyltransferase involved in cell wall biosynthesis
VARSEADGPDDPGDRPRALGRLLSPDAGDGSRAVIHVAEALGGGVLEVVKALANHTAAAGIPTVVVWGRRPETPAALEAEFQVDVRVVRVPEWGRRSVLPALRSALRAARVVRAEMQPYGGGIVHLHSSYAGFVGRLLPPARGWQVFYSPHGYAFQYESISAPVRAFTRASEAALGRRGKTFAVSEAEAALGAPLVGEGRIVVVQSGVSLPELPEARPARDGFRVVVVGRAAVHRRPGEVAAIARRLRNDLGADAVWLGDGVDRPVLEAAGIDVRGWRSRDELNAALVDGDAVLHLSAYEGFPVAVLEAMAAARPVVASDLPPIREALGDTGILVADAGEAEAALRRLHDDPELRTELGRRARARVADAFTIEPMAERALEAYGFAPAPSD